MYNMIGMSTSHLRMETLVKMEHNPIDFDIAFYEKREDWSGNLVGFFVPILHGYCPSDIPDDLRRCYEYADSIGADWIMFDGDEDEVPELPVYYDWKEV